MCEMGGGYIVLENAITTIKQGNTSIVSCAERKYTEPIDRSSIQKVKNISVLNHVKQSGGTLNLRARRTQTGNMEKQNMQQSCKDMVFLRFVQNVMKRTLGLLRHIILMKTIKTIK